MRQVTHALLTRPPLSHSSNRSNQSASFDLHVLSTPPAFILSQDQTLVDKFSLAALLLSKIIVPRLRRWNFIRSSPEQLTSYSFLALLFLGHLFDVRSELFLLEIFRCYLIVYCLIINVLFALSRQLI